MILASDLLESERREEKKRGGEVLLCLRVAASLPFLLGIVFFQAGEISFGRHVHTPYPSGAFTILVLVVREMALDRTESILPICPKT